MVVWVLMPLAYRSSCLCASAARIFGQALWVMAVRAVAVQVVAVRIVAAWWGLPCCLASSVRLFVGESRAIPQYMEIQVGWSSPLH